MKLAMYQMENTNCIQKNLAKSLHAIKQAAEKRGGITSQPFLHK